MNILNTCQACGKSIRGRSDKKYCNYLCRNVFHNTKNSLTKPQLRHVNGILRHNYYVLQRLHQKQIDNIPSKEFEQNGFNFQFFTSSQKIIGGRTCYFCYDLGYIPTESGYFALIAQNERPARTPRKHPQL